MSDRPLFTAPAFKDDKGLQLFSETDFLQKVSRLKAGEYTLVLFHKSRSAEANRYYWSAVVDAVAEAMGENDPEVTHEFLKYTCNPIFVTDTLTGAQIRVGGSTKVASPAFWKYIARVQQWAAETFGLVIEDPNPEWKKEKAA